MQSSYSPYPDLSAFVAKLGENLEEDLGTARQFNSPVIEIGQRSG